jgi:septal ring factor EnvC (AmiA/AmiB activator)
MSLDEKKVNECIERNCNLERCLSKHTGRVSVRCSKCLDKCRARTRKSYHKRGKRDDKLANTQEELARRNRSIWEIKRNHATVDERLATAHKRIEATEESNEELRRTLADAILAANGGTPTTSLPTAVSVRNESEVLLELKILSTQVATLGESRAADFAEFETRHSNMQERHDKTIAMLVHDIEELLKQSDKSGGYDSAGSGLSVRATAPPPRKNKPLSSLKSKTQQKYSKA